MEQGVVRENERIRDLKKKWQKEVRQAIAFSKNKQTNPICPLKVLECLGVGAG